MSYGDDIARFQRKVHVLSREVFVSLATKVHASVKEGSVATGAPGQPVDTGNLRNSWVLGIGGMPAFNGSAAPQFIGPAPQAIIATNVEYAEAIEDGVGPHGPLTLRSLTGGFHSAKLTIAGADFLQAEAVRELAP